MPRKERVTESAVRIVRNLSTSTKVVLACAATVSVLYGAITFIIRVEFERYERERQKIGRPEFKAYKERLERELEKVNAKIEKLDERIDNFHRDSQ